MSTDDTTTGTTSGSGTGPGADARAAKKAQREAERAARAQRKADAARERAMEAARAGGLFEGMEAMPRTEAQGREERSGDGGDSTPTTSSTAAASPAAASASSTAGREPAARGTATREPADPARTRRLTALLAVASVVLLALTGVFTWQYVEARDATAVEESVAAAPAEATDAAREIATQMFSYDHRTVDNDLAAVRERLTDPALKEFVEQSMPNVAAAAKKQEASVYATVAAAAPQEVVDSDHVTVLVMLNRMVSTKESPEAASSASRLSLQMARVDGSWKLAKLDAL